MADQEIPDRATAQAAEWLSAQNVGFDAPTFWLVAGLLKLYIAAERDAERERCCRDVCSYCRDGDVPERRMYSHPPKPFWVHTMIGFDDRTEDCNAGEIHERLGKSAIRSRVAEKEKKA